jgi:hypothetical protein
LRESPKKKKAPTYAATKTANQKAAPGRENWKSDDSQDEIDDEFGSSDIFCPEVRTQDLPNTQDFGGAQTLYHLHSDKPQFGENPASDNKN